MKLVMLKGGHYEVQEDDGTLIHTIESFKWNVGGRREIRYPRKYGGIWMTAWRLNFDHKKDQHKEYPGDFASLRKLIKSLEFTYINHPGPFKILEGL